MIKLGRSFVEATLGRCHAGAPWRCIPNLPNKGMAANWSLSEHYHIELSSTPTYCFCGRWCFHCIGLLLHWAMLLQGRAIQGGHMLKELQPLSSPGCAADRGGIGTQKIESWEQRAKEE